MTKGLINLHSSFEKGINRVFQIASYISIVGNLMDIKKNHELLFLNGLNLSVIAIVLILYYTKKLRLKICFTILIYSIVTNIFIGKFIFELSPDDPVRVYIFLRDSIFTILLLSLAAFALHKLHAVIIGLIYLFQLFIFDALYKYSFIHENLILISVVFIAYIGLTYYLVQMFENALINQQDKNQFIEKQNTDLNEANRLLSNANRLLKERQVMIEEQSKQIVTQSNELKLKNEELGRLNISKDMFLSIIAHDLKNPFNVIKGYAEILNVRYERLDDSQRKQYIDSIEKTSALTYNLLDNLLSWARAQNNSMQINPDYVFLNPLVLEIGMLFKEAFKQKNINFHYTPVTTVKAYIDPEMISTVIRNLISNAVKFTFPGGNITVDLQETRTDAVIIISDDGIGINPDNLQNLFKIDRHNTTTGTKGEAGSGLGLILCKLFVEKNKGQLQVFSEREGGTQFKVILPKNEIVF